MASTSDCNGTVIFYVTEQCNMNCYYCGVSEYRDTESPKAPSFPLREMIDFVRDCNRVFHITLTGGEPLLIQDFGNVISALTQLGHVSIMTNLSGRKLERVLVDSLNIDKNSFHFNVTCHLQQLRERKLLSLFMQNIEFLCGEGFSFSIEITLDPLLRLSEIRKVAEKIESDFGHKVNYRSLSWKQYPERYSKEMRGLFSPSSNEVQMFIRGVSKGALCIAGYSSFAIDVYGNIFRCFDEMLLRKPPIGKLGTKFVPETRLGRCSLEKCGCPVSIYHRDIFELAIKEVGWCVNNLSQAS